MSGKLFVNDRCQHAKGMTRAYDTPEEITKEWNEIIENTIRTEDLTDKLDHVRIYEARNP